MATISQIVDALSHPAANERRIALSKLLNEFALTNAAVERIVGLSPITTDDRSDSAGKIVINPPTWSNFRDYLPWQVRLCLILHLSNLTSGTSRGKADVPLPYYHWPVVEDAITKPNSASLGNPGSKTGYHWGVATCTPQGKNLEYILGKIADHYHKETGKRFDFSHLVRGVSTSTTTTSSTATKDSFSMAGTSFNDVVSMHDALMIAYISNNADCDFNRDGAIEAHAAAWSELEAEFGGEVIRGAEYVFEEALKADETFNFEHSRKAFEEAEKNADEFFSDTKNGGAVYKKLKDHLLEALTGGDSDEAPAAASGKPALSIPADMADLLNPMIHKASGGAIADINEFLRESSAVENERDELKRKIARVGTAGTMTAAKPASGDIPDGKVKMVKVLDIFAPKSGRTSKEMREYLDFEIPFFEWEAEHPFVPGIDEEYIFDTKILARVLYGLQSGSNVYLHGHTGSGKTTFVEQVAARLNWPLMRVNFDSEIGRLELIGRETLTTDPGTGSTISKFIDGVFPQALEMGAIMIFDEFDYIRPDAAIIAQRLLEGKGLLIAEDGGRNVTPAASFRIIACCNTRGQGDEFGCYPGARPQPASTLDRFPIFAEIPYLSEKREASLITSKVPACDADTARKFAKVATEIRKAFVNAEILQTVSPRGLLSAASQYAFFSGSIPEKEAIAMAIDSALLGKATSNDHVTIKEICQRTLAI
ncbi:Aerobic cobaltochelatase subunit CobS (Hydrogenobyrinic acid a [Durusdinium trenchii]|uniref:Aerobic cobaltochelatase subunit CobS (Hydrogenobyrinic acid a) n=1 Tax=Durusdinium trenchii TaxID=1381693 RepID=A0ABP0QVP5_9DINO